MSQLQIPKNASIANLGSIVLDQETSVGLPKEASIQVQQNFPEHLVALTTLLDRSLNARTSFGVSIRPHGVYLLSDELIKSTEAGQFSWKVSLWGQSIESGKFYPRELTEEEIEAAKNKKAGKKDAPKVDLKQDVEETPESKQKEAEDKYKNPSVRWEVEEIRQKLVDVALKKEEALRAQEEDPERKTQIEVVPEKPFLFQLTGSELSEMEKSLNQGKTILRVERYCHLPEEELLKLRKKVKGNALKDTRNLVCHATLDLNDIQKPGSRSTLIRAPLVQVGDLNDEEECNEYKFSNSYVKIEISSSSDECFTPPIHDIFPKVESLESSFRIPKKISSRDTAEKDFENILMKSLITVSEDYRIGVKPDKDGGETEKKLTQHQRNQLTQKKIQRKHDFVKKFIIGSKFQSLKSEMSPFILRIIHDKMEKEMGADRDRLRDADRIISELNIYFQRQLEHSITAAISQIDGRSIHEDLVESYFEEKKFRKSFIEEVKSESTNFRTLRLALEYESLNLKDMAEKRFKDLALSKDPPVLQEFMEFDLRQGNYVRAEETMWKILDSKSSNKNETILIQACFYLRRGLPEKTLDLIEKLLLLNKFKTLLNTFMAFLYNFYFSRPKLCKKYFAVSQRVRLRELKMIPPVDPKAPPGKPQEKIPELPDKENDELWLELANYFSKFCFIELSFKALQMVRNKESYRCLSIYSILEFLKGDLEKAEGYLDKMASVGGSQMMANVFLFKATNAFFREYYYQAEEHTYNAFQRNPELKEDFSTLLRLGYIYLRRRSYEDAKEKFESVCSMKGDTKKSESALSWLGLGISCYRIGEKLVKEVEGLNERDQVEREVKNREQADVEFKRAESALRMANILDPTNSEVWGYSILLSLKDERKVDQASKLLGYMLDLEIENLELLFEVMGIYADCR